MNYRAFLSHLVLCLSLLTLNPLYANSPEATVNINTASAEELAAHMTGVGPTRAKAIVNYRDQHGPFTQIDDLLAVEGIGEVTLERNRNVLIVQ